MPTLCPAPGRPGHEVQGFRVLGHQGLHPEATVGPPPPQALAQQMPPTASGAQPAASEGPGPGGAWAASGSPASHPHLALDTLIFSRGAAALHTCVVLEELSVKMRRPLAKGAGHNP